MTLAGAIVANAQDYKTVTKYAILSQFENAKKELDKVMADPKAANKAESWFWKAKIYAGFYKEETLHNKYPNSQVIADEAYQKYVSLEPSLKLLKDNNGQDLLVNLYAPSFNSGIASFNAKNWDSAFYYFAFAAKYSDVIYGNKFSTNTTQIFDTTAILYAGYAAQNADKPNEAIKFYERLIDNNIYGPTYLEMYRFTLINAINTKNEASFQKYLAVSKSKYPKEDWEDFELTYFTKNYTLAEKETLYDKEDAAGTISAKKYAQYGSMFANLTNEEKEKIDTPKQEAYLLKAADAFKKAFAKNNTDGISAFNAGVIYYNIFGIQDDKASQFRRALQELNTNRVVEKDPKKKTASDPKKKTASDLKKKAASDAKFNEQADALKTKRIEAEKPMIAAADMSIEYLEKAFNILKEKSDRNKDEKNCLNKSVDYLSNIYIFKRDKAKSKDVKAYDEFDAKFKLYDGLHGKYAK